MTQPVAGRVISSILKHDRKETSYKIALLRAINDASIGSTRKKQKSASCVVTSTAVSKPVFVTVRINDVTAFGVTPP